MDNKLWGGRFKNQINQQFFQFQKSIHYDYRLVEYDLYHSLIHVGALYHSALLTKNEYLKLSKALNSILKEVKADKFSYQSEAEDIHTDIQNRLESKVGKVALKLHTFRSRNDQIAFDEKWYCLHEAINILHLLNNLLDSLAVFSDKYSQYYMPGYTHTQRAQVVSLSEYIAAYHEMLGRDFDRIDSFLSSLCIYIGSGALAGSPLPRDNYQLAIRDFLDNFKDGFRQALVTVAKNSLDNVSDRDFIVQFLSDLAIVQMHLSRMAEDFILYSTKEFCFFDLPEEFCTGSSLMPHKKNPDFLELVRGNTGRIYGNLFSLLTMLKGLPLTYNRDMQLDKEPLFSSVDTIKQELELISLLIKGIKLNENKINKALEDEGLYATELAEFLVYNGVAFKQAHNIIGQLIRYSLDNKIKIKDIEEDSLKKFHNALNHKDLRRIMCPQYAILSKRSKDKSILKRKKVRSRP